MRQRVVLVFLDGVGLCGDSPSNPFTRADMPCLKSLVGGPLTNESVRCTETLVFKGTDACLGVPGIPQSATGQTALFTGINAPAMIGYHFPAFPNQPLKCLIARHSLPLRIKKAGYSTIFANAYTPSYFEMVKAGKREHSVTTLSFMAAGIPFLTVSDLNAGRAVYWDITNEIILNVYGLDVPAVTPEEAGRHCGAFSRDYDCVVFESFLPDIAGHKGDLEAAVGVCERLDGFFYGILDTMGEETTLIVCSDHGNCEDTSRKDHTMNPAMFLAAGRGAAFFTDVDAITDIAPRVLSLLSG